jgi:hypothetical protein
MERLVKTPPDAHAKPETKKRRTETRRLPVSDEEKND